MLSADQTPATTPRVGRRKVNFDKMPARFPEGTFARIDAVLAEGENRSDFLRIAVEAEAARRLAPPVQDTKAGPVADYEGKQARRAKGPEHSKTLSPTLPAGDPVKAATKAPERAGDDAPLRFPTAPLGSLSKEAKSRRLTPKPKR